MRLQNAAIVSQCVWRQWVAQREFGNLKMAVRKKDSFQLESVPKVVDNIDSLSTDPLVKMERINLIGVDNFLCVCLP